MMLLIDQGNSNIRWAVRDADSWTTGEGMGFVDSVVAKPGRVLISSVAGDERRLELQSWLKSTWNIVPEWLEAKPSQLGVYNCYDEPGRLGVDRWLAVIAAYHLSTGAVLVVDAGTALTVDAVDKDGKMLGGAIFPGPGLIAASLGRGTGRIGEVVLNLTTKDNGPESSTSLAVSAGVAVGYPAAAIALVLYYWQRLPKNSPVWVTGGGGISLMEEFSGQAKTDPTCAIADIIERMTYQPDLVLKGLEMAAGEPR
ncbi:MAG: type III pantothenate kinase [Gammaproteobacteria bacterium]|nr:type III pantothenate kinase [Gammaproteobacteria bacterium]